MKTFNEYLGSQKQEIEESPIRTTATVLLLAKISNIRNQMLQHKYQVNDSVEENLKRISLKLDLLGEQNRYTGMLISELGLLKH